MTKTSIAWLRNDLRIADNPALSAAVSRGDPVVALYIHEENQGIRAPGAAGQWWLHQSLVALGADLAERGIELQVQRGDSAQVLDKLIAKADADAVFWNRRYAPAERAVDEAIKKDLHERGLTVDSFAANVLAEPWTIATGQGKPYSVYSPFWKTLRDMPIEMPLRRPDTGSPIKPSIVDSDYREPHWV